jgi:hypothetical protein
MWWGLWDGWLLILHFLMCFPFHTPVRSCHLHFSLTHWLLFDLDLGCVDWW